MFAITEARSIIRIQTELVAGVLRQPIADHRRMAAMESIQGLGVYVRVAAVPDRFAPVLVDGVRLGGDGFDGRAYRRDRSR